LIPFNFISLVLKFLICADHELFPTKHLKVFKCCGSESFRSDTDVADRISFTPWSAKRNLFKPFLWI
jgi:hypothetical protein